MVKSVLVLVMLQICYCFMIDVNQNIEMIASLRKLKVGRNLTSSSFVPVPGPYMLENPYCCVHTFRKNLLDILRDARVNGTEETERKKLRENLEDLGGKLSDQSNCKMQTIKTHGKNFIWIDRYIKFLRELNNSNSIC